MTQKRANAPQEPTVKCIECYRVLPLSQATSSRWGTCAASALGSRSHA